MLELWQANAFGRYVHPADSDSSGPLDPDFQGYGTLRAGNDGQFRIKTIKPPPYSGRTPHIHFIVANGRTRLTTQMFFEGEAGNERDGLYRYLSVDDRRASTGRYIDRARGAEDGSLAVVVGHRTAGIAMRAPAIFLGHGSPMNAIEHNAHTEAWARIGRGTSGSRRPFSRSPRTGTSAARR